MAGFTAFLSEKVLKHVFGLGSYTPPAQCYASLHTAAPIEGGASSEVTAGSYARIPVTLAAIGGEPYMLRNAADMLFAIALSNWGTITHAGVYDALTGGNLLAENALDTPRTINTNDRAQFAAATFRVTLT